MLHIGRSLGSNEKCLVLGFVGFSIPAFNPVWNFITLALKDDFPIAVADISKGEVPDYLFFSVFDHKGQWFSWPNNAPHLQDRYAKCVKIFVCDENVRRIPWGQTPWHDCDYAITYERSLVSDERHLRVPPYYSYLTHLKDHTGKTIIKPFDNLVGSRMVLDRKTHFCNFIYSNSSARERILFFEMLSKYKKVDSGGGVLNNMGGHKVGDKLKFIEDYKFTIAFENSRDWGYVSEKIVEPMISYSIPIYWGCRDIGLDFNARSFVNANEPVGSDDASLVGHFEKIIREIEHLDTHDDAYLATMSEPWYPNNVPNKDCRPEHIREFMQRVFDTRHTRNLRPSSP
jgi:hypothetical protein